MPRLLDLSRLQQVILGGNRDLENYEAGHGQPKIHDFIWSELCDWYVELI
jgi:valyl-tRNA synthetase